MSGHEDQGRTRPGGHGSSPGRVRPQPGFLPPLNGAPDRTGENRETGEPGIPGAAGSSHPAHPAHQAHQAHPAHPAHQAYPPSPSSHPPDAARAPIGPVGPPAPVTRPANTTPLGIMTIVTAIVLMISAFLPWAHARTSLTMLGRSLGRDLGSIAGVDADGSGQLIPVLALVALGAIAWGMIAGNPRICTYAAAPGALAFLCCGIFLFRLNDAQERLDFGPGGFDYVVTLGYGWFIALVAALILVGLSLAALVTTPRTRTGRSSRPGPGHGPGVQSPDPGLGGPGQGPGEPGQGQRYPGQGPGERPQS